MVSYGMSCLTKCDKWSETHNHFTGRKSRDAAEARKHQRPPLRVAVITIHYAHVGKAPPPHRLYIDNHSSSQRPSLTWVGGALQRILQLLHPTKNHHVSPCTAVVGKRCTLPTAREHRHSPNDAKHCAWA